MKMFVEKVGDKKIIWGIVEKIKRKWVEESIVHYSLNIYEVLPGTRFTREVYFDPKKIDVKIGELYYFYVEYVEASHGHLWGHWKLTEAKRYEDKDNLLNPDTITGSGIIL